MGETGGTINNTQKNVVLPKLTKKGNRIEPLIYMEVPKSLNKFI